MLNFEYLRQKYPDFIYKGYSYSLDASVLRISYDFEIVGLASFSPEWKFPVGDDFYPQSQLLDNMVFSLGMVELISYWKATCSPNVIILPHGIDFDMKTWWKELYFGGLGEFFYVNKIQTDFDCFMNITSDGDMLEPSQPLSLSGNLVPVGGGKDSAVTLRLLNCERDITRPYIINSRGATDETCTAAGYADAKYEVKRTIDKELINLNSKGYLNGHTPFSAIVAFSSLIAAYITGKKYVVLSNESSANESTVLGEEINHQFSKGEVFESAFIAYEKKYINSGVEYFSLLRPLSEMQIAALFSRFTEYHHIFKSCNAGSKKDIWCCNCPKCLFVFTILSPFLSLDYLSEIFSENLFDKSELLEIYRKLIGVLPDKPFECVGSRDEVLTASFVTLKRLKSNGEAIPCLLDYLDKEVNLSHSSMEDYISFYDTSNHLPPHFSDILQKALKEYTEYVR